MEKTYSNEEIKFYTEVAEQQEKELKESYYNYDSCVKSLYEEK